MRGTVCTRKLKSPLVAMQCKAPRGTKKLLAKDGLPAGT